MEHSVVQALKKQLLDVVLARQPEASVQLFAMAAMHGDVDTLDLIIERVGDKLGNLDEMVMVRDGLKELVQQLDEAEARERAAEDQAAQETKEFLGKFKL